MDIRYAIGVVKYGFEEYQKAVKENPDFDINEKDMFKCTLLHNAVSMRKWDIAKDLIKRGIDVTPQDYRGCTVLHYLCDDMNTDVETVEAVLNAGGDPNIKSKDEMTPLYSIAGRNWNKNTESRYQILKLLMEYGGDKTLPCTKHGVSSEKAVEIIGDRKAIALLNQYEPIRLMDENADPETRYLPIIDEIKIMLGEKEITDEEIWKKISETPEIIKISDKRSSNSLFLLTIPSGRLELAKKLAENGADVNEKSTLPFFNGNALNGATTAEMAEWLLSLGLKVEKNLVREQENRTTPYDNPAVNAASRNDADMMRYWLTKEKELFAEEPEYLEELFEKSISVAAKANRSMLLEFIIQDEELYPYLKKEYSDGTGWNPKVSAKLRKQALKLIEAEELKPQVKELTNILTQRAKGAK
jgi:ankyrin repeat protein